MPVMWPMRRMVCRWTRPLSGRHVPVHHVEAAPAALFADDIGAAVEIKRLLDLIGFPSAWRSANRRQTAPLVTRATNWISLDCPCRNVAT